MEKKRIRSLTKGDVLADTEKLSLLSQIDKREIARFNGEPYLPIVTLAALLDEDEQKLMKILAHHHFVSVDLEFQERKDNYVVHDGESATGRPLVMGVTWRGLKCLAMELDTEKARELARDIIIVEYEEQSPTRQMEFYEKQKAAKKSGNRTIRL
jgi:hypothetical protein